MNQLTTLEHLFGGTVDSCLRQTGRPESGRHLSPVQPSTSNEFDQLIIQSIVTDSQKSTKVICCLTSSHLAMRCQGHHPR
jgi:hypothetical protein